MAGLMNHAEVSELLGAYALDAVEPEEAAAIEVHLESCPRCRDELRAHREVVGMLAYAGQDAPEGLWDRVVARINDPSDGDPRLEAPPIRLRLAEVDRPSGVSGPAGPPSAPVSASASASGPVSGSGSGSAGSGAAAARRWWGANRVTGLVAAAAVVIVALLGAEVVRLQERTNHLSGQISAMAAAPTMATVRQALAVPGAVRVALKPVSGGADRLDAVILPGGQGYLYDSSLSPLSPARTYQLWGVVGEQRISYGVLGSTPQAVVPFRASAGVKALAVTAEVAGGVVTSTQRPVAVGFVS